MVSWKGLPAAWGCEASLYLHAAEQSGWCACALTCKLRSEAEGVLQLANARFRAFEARRARCRHKEMWLVALCTDMVQ
jgi:hypothetical protein